MNENLVKVLEWSVWNHLDSIKDKELILLKGHLLVEMVLSQFLSDNHIDNYENFSFYRKIKETEQVIANKYPDALALIERLFELNKIRNKLAHEFQYDSESAELDNWADSVLLKFEGMKFTQYTPRTKVVHAFSGIIQALYDLK